MKRLAIIGGSLSRGGAERVMVYLADYMVKHGVITKIITSKRNDNEYELPKGVQRICLSKNTSSSSKIDIPIQIRRLQKIIRKNEIDTVLFIGVPTCLYAIPGCTKTGATVFVSERNDPTHFAGKKIVKYISRKLMEKADGYIFQTEDAKKYYEKRLNGRGIVIFNPLFNEKLPDVYVGEREKKIVSVGRLDSQKNQKILIEAFTRIAKDYPDYNLIFYGEGPLRETLKRQIENHSMQKRIFLEGNVSNLFDYINSAAIFVMTSNFEGMPNALLEAMALGLPCISTDCPCGGPRSLIETGKNGLLVPVGDIKALEKALRLLLNSPDFAESLGREATQIRKKVDIDNIGRQWLEYMSSF